MERQYLVFITDVGTNLDEKYVYHFYFSETPEVVWGDYWNVCPASIIPEVKPDLASISTIYECQFDEPINLVTKNSCFSMQDCIDQIIAIGWFDVDSNMIYDEEGHVTSFKFGEDFEYVKRKIKFFKYDMELNYERIDETDDMIDNLIEKLGGNSDGLEW